MITESIYWKEELGRLAKALAARRRQRRWNDRSFALAEKQVMIGAFCLRKLLDSRKLSDELEAVQLKVIQYPPKKKVAHFFNRFKIDELFDLEKSKELTRSVRWVMSQIVHRYVFALWSTEEGCLDAVAVSSDFERERGLFLVTVEALVSLFKRAEDDHIAEVDARFDEKLKDYVLVKRAASVGPKQRRTMRVRISG